MPKVSGLELLERIRLAHMTVPAIMVTGTLPAGYSNLQLTAMLLKPFAPDQLLANVENVFAAPAAAPINLLR